MKDHLISLFIDNELDLDEKIEFVEIVHNDTSFKDDTVELLTQEKLLRTKMVAKVPGVPPTIRSAGWKTICLAGWRPLLAGSVMAMLLAAALFLTRSGPELGQEVAQRFVIFRPQTESMAIMGTFTDWSPLPMEKIGSSGYWAITLRLKPGEHHYSFRLEDGLQIADPTVPWRERDDFGGENSIISVSTSI